MKPLKMKKIETLNEGTYIVPDDCTALYYKRKVIVKKMKKAGKSRIFRCHDCIHQRMGRKTRKNQLFESPYCELRPKVIHGEKGYNFSAPDGRVACYMFKKKEDRR